MSKLTDRPLRDPDKNSKAWDAWFREIEKKFPEIQPHIANASTTHAVTDWATTNTALNTLGTKINSILSALESAKVFESS
jgi:hypothetical protein